MNNLRKLALGIIPTLVLCTAPMAWSASAESGTVGETFTWTLENDFLTITALDGSYTVTSDGEVLTITGTTYTHGLDIENVGELDAALQFLIDNPASRYVIDVEEVNDLIPFLSSDEMKVTLTEKVRYVAEGSLQMIPKYSIVTVRNAALSLDGSGLGYDGNGEARVIGIHGYAGSPAENYANSNEAFEFFPLEGSGKWDEDGLLTWEIKNELLTLYAADGSYKMEFLPDEVLVTGTAFTGLPKFAWSDENMTMLLFIMNLDIEPDRLVFDVERIDFDINNTEVNISTEGMDFVLSERVQSICEYGLYWVEAGTDVYVESRMLELEGSYLGQYLNGETIEDSVTIHGYLNSPAQAYAEEHDLPFVTLSDPTKPLALGDVNGNGNVDASDAALLLSYAAQLGAGLTESDDVITLTTAQLDAADINKDGEHNAADAAIILAYSAAVGSGQGDANIEDFIS